MSKMAYDRAVLISAVSLAFVLTSRGFAQSAAPASTTGWDHGHFRVDVSGVIHRSDIILGRPNRDAGQAMPLGNGRLGVAVWSADGLTAQLNRADTLPDRLSPGQVVVPGLSALTGSVDYTGRLNLYDGELHEQGGGMSATVYVEPDTDTLAIDVTGANPDQQQTALLKLWEPRKPRAATNGPVGLLSEAWVDNVRPESSGRPFGSLAAITAKGRNVSAAVTDPLTVTVAFTPFADGHFRILAAAPHYDGTQQALAAARPALVPAAPSAHRLWWNAYWKRAATIKVSSADGAGEYMENLRNIYLFAAAAERGIEYPGTQAGVADMLSSGRDAHRWDASAFWHWNLRMQVAANIGAGLYDLNAPYFNLYRENLPNIQAWTHKYMSGLPGACIAETMRFNGRGIEYEASWNPISIAHDCDANWTTYFNARTMSTGAEVALWVWEQYLATNDRAFLERNYRVMASSARFLLAYQNPGRDGLLHTSPSNAHETQWDVTDPTTDIAAAMALYPAVIQAAKLVGRDPDLVRQLQAALPKIPALPRTQLSGTRTLLPPSADSEGQDMIAESYLPGAPNHNAENIGLEPIWPYEVIGDTSPLFPLARRTYDNRLFKGVADWSFDPIQAARLHLGSEVGAMLIRVTEHSQHTVNGFANWDKRYGEFYVEETGIVADALEEALAQDYDGTIRIAPAIPPGWDFDGSVFVRGKTKVDVQVHNAAVTTAVIEAGASGLMAIRNPWHGQAVDIVSGTGTRVVKADSGTVLHFHAVAGTSYLIAQHDAARQPFAAVSGVPASTEKHLGNVQIGIAK
jgi:alpha-L-fucosidase 2